MLIRKTGSAAYSTTIDVQRSGHNQKLILDVETGSTRETTLAFTVRQTILWINKGCGAERNRVALGSFAAYVQQQWSAMHEEDTTCTYCGQQFLPSMIEEHQEKCEGASSPHTGARHAGDMLDYLKDDRVLYNRLKKGDYCLLMEPTLEATGESRMHLVLIKQVACISCGKSFQANKLEHHRRWECKWDIVKSTSESETLSHPGLPTPSEGFKKLKNVIEWAIPSKPADNYIIIEGEQYPMFIPFKNTIDSATRAMLEIGYQLNFENSDYRSDPVAADAAAAVATALADDAAEAVVVAQDEAAKEGVAPSENNQFATSIEALRLQMVSLETKAIECRQAAKNHYNVGDEVSAMHELQRAKMLAKQSRSTQVAIDALNQKSDLLEQRELEKTAQEAIEKIHKGLNSKMEELGLTRAAELLTDADSKLQDRLGTLAQDVEGGLGQLEPEEVLHAELQSNANAGNVDGPYFKLQNQSSKAFLAVEIGDKNERVIYDVDSAPGENQLWSEVSGKNGYFKLKHKRTGKCLAAHWRNWEVERPIVFHWKHNDQLWKKEYFDSSSPLSFRLKNYEKGAFLGEKGDRPSLYQNVGEKGSESWEHRYVWKAIPHGDTSGGQNIALMQAAADEKEAALQKVMEENASVAEQAAAKAEVQTSKAALREAEQAEAKILKELQQMVAASASAKSVVQLIDYAKIAADAAVAFDKLTATMIFVGAFCLSIIHPSTPYSWPQQIRPHGC